VDLLRVDYIMTNEFDRLAVGLVILKDYMKVTQAEPRHDFIEVWIDEDKPMNPVVVAFLDHIGWFQDEEDSGRFTFCT